VIVDCLKFAKFSNVEYFHFLFILAGRFVIALTIQRSKFIIKLCLYINIFVLFCFESALEFNNLTTWVCNKLFLFDPDRNSCMHQGHPGTFFGG